MKSLPIKSREDIERIKQRYRENNNYRDLLVFLLSINTGAKLVEMLKLTVADIKKVNHSFQKMQILGVLIKKSKVLLKHSRTEEKTMNHYLRQ